MDSFLKRFLTFTCKKEVRPRPHPYGLWVRTRRIQIFNPRGPFMVHRRGVIRSARDHRGPSGSRGVLGAQSYTVSTLGISSIDCQVYGRTRFQVPGIQLTFALQRCIRVILRRAFFPNFRHFFRAIFQSSTFSWVFFQLLEY